MTLTNILLAIISFLLAGLLFFLKYWFQQVNERMKTVELMFTEVNVLKSSYGFLIAMATEAKSEIKEIRTILQNANAK